MSVPARIEKVSTLRDILQQQIGAFRQVIPKHMTPERLIRIACAAASREPKLLLCTSQSMLVAVMTAAQLGLETGSLGFAFLVPFENKKVTPARYEVQLIIGFRGMIDLARRSGQIDSIRAHNVYANDAFEYEEGLEPVLKHRPVLTKERGDIVMSYAIACFKGGGKQLEVMTREDVDSIRMMSQAGRKGYGPWEDHFGEMARKTVVRRLYKYLPVSVEMATALELEDRADRDETQLDVMGLPEIPDAPSLAPAGGIAEAKQRLRSTPSTGKAISVKDESGSEISTPPVDDIPAWDGKEPA